MIEAAPFRLVHRHILLCDRRQADTRLPPQYGDVAEVGGRLIAGARMPTKDGEAWGFRHYTEGEVATAAPLIVPEDLGQLIDEKIAQGAHGFWSLGPPDRAELDRFCDLWPDVSSLLGLKRDVEPVRLFDPGECRYPRVIERNVSIGSDQWRHWIDAHSRGDWGLFGDHVADLKVTPELQWTAWLEPQNVRNSIAVLRREGGVKSRYLLPDSINGRLPEFPTWKQVRRIVSVESVFAKGGHNRTLATVEQMGF
jgi:hypothetical protein